MDAIPRGPAWAVVLSVEVVVLAVIVLVAPEGALLPGLGAAGALFFLAGAWLIPEHRGMAILLAVVMAVAAAVAAVG